MKKALIFLFFAFLLQSVFAQYRYHSSVFRDSIIPAQYRNHTWLFGDSILFRFDPVTNIPSVSVGNGRTAAMSAVLCDEVGNIDLYTNGWNLYNHLNEYTPNGISYHGLNYGPVNPFLSNFGTVTGYRDKGVFFIPSSINDSIYYLYQHINPDTFKTFKIDLTADNGKGDIAFFSKKTTTFSSNRALDFGSYQIKHGNGRDWWNLSTTEDITGNPNFVDAVVRFLIQDSVIYDPDLIEIDSLNFLNQINFLTGDSLGEKLCISGIGGTLFLTKFNRCSGELYDSFFVLKNYAFGTCVHYFGPACFSKSGRYLYTCNLDTIFQFDTQSWNGQDILNSRQIIYTNSNPTYYDSITLDCINPLGWGFRGMRLGPDGKIYIGSPHINSALYASNPPDTLGDFNTHLSTIEFPDSAGAGCAFQLWSVPLGRVYYDGLGSAPNYYLGPLENSPCDTLITTGLSEQSTKPKITLFPNPAQTEATLTWSGVQEGAFVLRDMMGRALLQQSLSASSGTVKLNLSEFPKGIYLWQVQSKEHAQNGKLVVD